MSARRSSPARSRFVPNPIGRTVASTSSRQLQDFRQRVPAPGRGARVVLVPSVGHDHDGAAPLDGLERRERPGQRVVERRAAGRPCIR